VRVVSIEPESDLKGAAVRVVQEGPEFWNYVLTGQYIPSPNESQLPTRPVASNLRITEQQVVQGDTQFTELTATFDITGPVGNILVLAAGQEQELLEVAQTQTRTATWRIPQADVYSIVVRPFAPDGTAGVAASATYATEGADVPPVLVDLFDVQERSGGVRLYTWGWMSDTMRSADFAGVEIRYAAGHVTAPAWDGMTPVGDTGYHTAAFEAVVPASGEWTFACRSRNTSGELSTGMQIVQRTLGKNLGQNLSDITQEQVAQQQGLDQEKADRLQGDLQTAAAAGADATAKANAALAEALARVDALAGEIGEIVNAPQWLSTESYIAGWLVVEAGQLYRAKVANTNKRPSTSPATWELIGQFASAAEAAAAALQLATANASDLEAEALKIAGLQTRMPAGNGTLETKARVDQVDQARVAGEEALASSINSVSTVADGAQSTAGTALTAANNAASLAGTAQTTADGAESTASNALTAATDAANAVTQVGMKLGGGGNELPGADFVGMVGWTVNKDDSGGALTAVPHDGNIGDGARYIPSGSTSVMFHATTAFPLGWKKELLSPHIPVADAPKVLASVWVNCFRCKAILRMYRYNAAGTYLAQQEVFSNATNQGAATLANIPRLLIPRNITDAHTIRIAIEVEGTGEVSPYAWFVWPMVEKAPIERVAASPWSPSASGLDAKYATVTQQLSVGVDDVSGRLAAKQTLTTDVSGNIAGTITENDGVRSSFSILASVFRVITGGAASGMEWQANYIRIYGSGYQLVMGTGFGVSSNLVQWYGPNIGAAACTTANCVDCKTIAGQTIIRGTSAQGRMEITNTAVTVYDANDRRRFAAGLSI